MEISHKELKLVLNKSFTKDIPVMIYSSMGLGKSSIVLESSINYAKEHNLEFRDWNRMPDLHKSKAVIAQDLSKYLFFVDIRLSQKDPSDLTGIPYVQGDNMKWLPPSVMKLMSNPTCNAVLFFDELSDASMPVMKAAYQLVLDRCSGELSFSSNVRVVAAGNRSIDKCGVNDTPKALDNRFMNVELSAPTAEDWSKWAMLNQIDNRIISFILMSPSSLTTPVKNIQTKSFSTPRSVAKLSDLIKDETDRNLINILACAQCGDGFGTQFCAYLDNEKDVDPVELCKNPQSYTNLPLGAKWFSLSSLTSYYAKNGKKVIDGLIDVMNIMDPDMAYVQYFMNKEVNKLFPTQMSQVPQGVELYNTFSKYILED